MMDSFQSRLPFTVEKMRFARWVPGDAPGTRRLARFDQFVHWLANDETEVNLYINGVDADLSIGRCYSGEYYGSGIKHYVSDAAALAASFNLLPGPSIVEIAVLARRRERAMTRVELQAYDSPKNGPRFGWLDSQWYVGGEEIFARVEAFDWNAPAADDWHPGKAQLGGCRYSPQVKVWSSLSPVSPEEAERLFLETYPAPLQSEGEPA